MACYAIGINRALRMWILRHGIPFKRVEDAEYIDFLAKLQPLNEAPGAIYGPLTLTRRVLVQDQQTRWNSSLSERRHFLFVYRELDHRCAIVRPLYAILLDGRSSE
jgi:hypothetical protein